MSRHGKSSKGRGNPDKGIFAPFRVWHVFTTATATVDPFPIYPSDLGDYLNAERVFWKRWRLQSLTIRTFRAVAPVSVVSSGTFESAGDYHVGIGWIDTDNTTVSSTPSHNSLTQFSRFKASCGDCVLRVPKSELRGLSDWYLTTTTGTPPDALQSPGTAFVSVYLNSGFNTSVTHVYIEGVVHFMDRLDSSVSVDLIRENHLGREADDDRKTQDWRGRLASMSVEQRTALFGQLQGLIKPALRRSSGRLLKAVPDSDWEMSDACAGVNQNALPLP